jgi:diaminohydroxyphosphoribosylaminopyrimidine deaminase/5-amino-6-(5-phosphoribosylamino)uracil reductase
MKQEKGGVAMNSTTLMRQTLALARLGEGRLSFHPLESLLWIQDGQTRFAWHYESGSDLSDALKFAPHESGGVLCLYLKTTPAPARWIQTIQPETILIAGTIGETAYAPLGGLGLPVKERVLANQAAKTQAIWHHVRTMKRPFVTLSFGMSLDGKIATYTGDSKYISGEASRIAVHQQRNRHMAILVGIRTVLVDHPLLNARLIEGARHPIRIVLDSKLRIPETEPMLQGDHAKRTIVFTTAAADQAKIARLKETGATVIQTDSSDQVDLHAVLDELYRRGIDSVLVEGGGTVHFAFLEAGLADFVQAYVSPILIGGETAKSAVSGQGFATLKDSVKLNFTRIRRIGADLLLEAIPQKSTHRK